MVLWHLVCIINQWYTRLDISSNLCIEISYRTTIALLYCSGEVSYSSSIIESRISLTGLTIIRTAELIGKNEVVVSTEQQRLTLRVAELLILCTTLFFNSSQSLISLVDAIIIKHPHLFRRVITPLCLLLPEEVLVITTTSKTVITSHIVRIIRHPLVKEGRCSVWIGCYEQPRNLLWCIQSSTVVWQRIQLVRTRCKYRHRCKHQTAHIYDILNFHIRSILSYFWCWFSFFPIACQLSSDNPQSC